MYPESAFDRIEESTPVLDRDGQTLGSVARVHWPAHAVVARRVVAAGTADAVETMRREQPAVVAEPYLHVISAGAGGLRELYVPAMYVLEASTDAVVVNVERADLDDMGWHHRPAFAADA
jgi:hypothetical protein